MDFTTDQQGQDVFFDFDPLKEEWECKLCLQKNSPGFHCVICSAPSSHNARKPTSLYNLKHYQKQI